MLQTIITNLNQLAQYVPWDAVMYAPIVSPILLVIKKLAKIDNGEVMIWLLMFASGLTAAVAYLMSTSSADPRVIAFQAFITMIATQPFYKLILKPLTGYVGSQITAEIAKAAQFNSEIKSAAIPAVAVMSATGTPSAPVTIAGGQIVHPDSTL